MRMSMGTGVEPPKAGLLYAQLESFSAKSTILGIPIDTYESYAAVSCQLVEV